MINKIYDIIQHDPEAYTQGYFFKNNILYESTGLYGRSSLRKIDPSSGNVLYKINIDSRYFAEGIECYSDKIYMLTWKEQVCKVFDLNTFEMIDSYSYSGEGWGLSLYQDKFYMSDGSNVIKIIDPKNFKTIDSFEVFDINQKPLKKLNELQVIDDLLITNVWFSDKIHFIDLETKKAVKSIDLGELRKELNNPKAEAMNGIAYDNNTKLLYITGKLWDKTFKLQI